MTRTEDRLQDALHAMAGQVRDDLLHPLSPSDQGPGSWRGWLVPAAAAASVALVIGLVVAVTGGPRPGPGRAAAAAAPPSYYVTFRDVPDNQAVQIHATATGQVTAEEPAPKAPSGGLVTADALAAAPGDRTFYVEYDAFTRTARQIWIFSFTITNTGTVTPLVPVRGGVLNGQAVLDNRSSLAVSPDGAKLALTTSTTIKQASAYYSQADKIVVIDLRTGARTTWQGGLNRGNLYPTIQNLSWGAGGRSLVFLALWCDYPGPPKSDGLCSGASVPGGRRDAQVWSLPAGTGGGTLTGGRLLLQQSARFPVIAQALADPEGERITALVMSGAVTRYGVWQQLAVDQISAATGSLLSQPYRTAGGLGPPGTPDGVWLSSDPAGRFFLISYIDGLKVAVGWIGSGTFHPLPTRLAVSAASIAW
jgi:hypothetical protein